MNLDDDDDNLDDDDFDDDDFDQNVKHRTPPPPPPSPHRDPNPNTPAALGGDTPVLPQNLHNLELEEELDKSSESTIEAEFTLDSLFFESECDQNTCFPFSCDHQEHIKSDAKTEILSVNDESFSPYLLADSLDIESKKNGSSLSLPKDFYSSATSSSATSALAPSLTFDPVHLVDFVLDQSFKEDNEDFMMTMAWKEELSKLGLVDLHTTLSLSALKLSPPVSFTEEAFPLSRAA